MADFGPPRKFSALPKVIPFPNAEERRRANEFADRVMQAAQPHELIDVEPGDGVVRLHSACPSLEFQIEDAEALIERIREAIDDARGRGL